MQAFDASSMIHAWDNYPIDQIPNIWKWIEKQIKAKAFVLPEVAYEEVNHKAPDCSDWLKDADAKRLRIGQDIVMEALRIAHLLDIRDGKYDPKGVDENDLFIVACARLHECRLISEEGVQLKRPQRMAKYKIPAVCALPIVAVPCINFVALFKESKEVF